MKKIIFIFSVFLIISCRNHKSENLNFSKKDKLNVSSTKLKGKWYLNKWTLYHTLVFDENRIFVDNHIDSVFDLNYKLSKDTLITWSKNSGLLNKNRILKITKDTLILEDFLNTKEILQYSKTKRKVENLSY